MNIKLDSKEAEVLLKLINKLIPEEDKNFDFTEEETNVIVKLSYVI